MTSVQPLGKSSRIAILTYLAASAAVFLLMMIVGLVMRASQAQIIGVPPQFFYQLMTAHGGGMIVISGLASSAVLWYFLRRYTSLYTPILWINLGLFLTGVVFVLSSIFIGGFAGAWTFLFPLPSHGLGIWSTNAAASFVVGLLLIGVGFLIFYLEVARAILKEYGSIPKALGWPQLFANSDAPMPPATIVAGTMVFIVNILGILAGAVVLVLILVNLYVPSFEVDPLLTKNLTYFFGHVFINATIYQAVIAVYELLPQYTGRPWKVNRVFLAAWTASSFMVMAVYPHHLLLDFAMPTWMLIAGQILSYANGIPLIIVTAWGALTIVHRSGIKWDAASLLLMIAMFGWSAGVIPAIIDATVAVNKVMHNTLWVPGHFHFYLLIGLVAMLLGFMFYMINGDDEKNQKDNAKPVTFRPMTFFDRSAILIYTLGSIGFSLMFLVSGKASVPRRWAEHLPEWVAYSQLATIFGALIVVAMLILVIKIIARLPKARTI